MALKIEKVYTDHTSVSVTYKTRKVNILLVVWNYESRTNWGHKGKMYAIVHNQYGETVDYCTEGKIVYYNRTWEEYRFQSLIRKLMNNAMPEKLANHYFKLIDKAIKKAGRL